MPAIRAFFGVRCDDSLATAAIRVFLVGLSSLGPIAPTAFASMIADPPYVLEDSIAAGQNIKLQWTVNNNPISPLIQWTAIATCGGVTNTVTVTGDLDWNDLGGSFAGKACSFKFNAPSQATDWKQKIIGKDGSSDVFGGNIKKDSPWSFEPLESLPEILTRIPDLAPIAGGPDITIYTAVNLDLYMSQNPLGFLNGSWSVGQTLAELGVNITNGQLNGIQGIYWATTPFDFNPDPAGPGFTPTGGEATLLDSATFGQEITVLQQHSSSIPEPSTRSSLGIGVLILICSICRRHAT
jgi:hypothetical protein